MLKVYQCKECGKTLISKEELKLDGWVELVAGSTDAAQEKHVPVVTKKCKTVKVNVGILNLVDPSGYCLYRLPVC